LDLSAAFCSAWLTSVDALPLTSPAGVRRLDNFEEPWHLCARPVPFKAIGFTAGSADRTIINIKPEHVDAWLNPDPGDLAALYRIFDDKRHPFYEHKLAA
jgi:hypothetical protein